MKPGVGAREEVRPSYKYISSREPFMFIHLHVATVKRIVCTCMFFTTQHSQNESLGIGLSQFVMAINFPSIYSPPKICSHCP